MNPNLKIFLRWTAIAVIAVAAAAGLFFVLNRLFHPDWRRISYWGFRAFFWLIMLCVLLLIFAVTFQHAYTNILRRSEVLPFIAPDKNGRGFHLIGRHHQPGGRGSSGFYSYQHYYIVLQDGKLWLSRKTRDEKNIQPSLVHLSEQTGQSLSPDYSRQSRLGIYKDSSNVFAHAEFTYGNYHIDVKGFNQWLDNGFVVHCYSADKKLLWKRKF